MMDEYDGCDPDQVIHDEEAEQNSLCNEAGERDKLSAQADAENN